jgi:RNase H-like domain found in reverse transcriptase
LRDLIKFDVKFIVWNDAASNSFAKLKKEIVKQNTLVHFNEKFLSEIFCDASGSCLGAILSQIQPNGESRIVQYTLRTLNAVEQRYSNTER